MRGRLNFEKIFLLLIFIFGLTSTNFCSAAVKFGDTGEEVAEVQRCLIAQSLLSGEADGICGQATVDAIKTFQEAVGLTVDGICGEETFKLLRAAAYGEIDVTTLMTGGGTSNQNFLKPGDSGEKVLELQKLLINLGCLDGKADGMYGPATSDAVKKFQAAHGLKVDGICGEKTFSLIGQAAEVEFELQTSSPAGFVLKIGDSGQEVQSIQNSLIRLGYLSGTADGIFGGGTETALKKFQAANGLNPDGVCGERTLKLLNNSQDNFSENYSGEGYAEVGDVIKPGMKGPGVTNIQNKLNELGFYDGNIDGICGESTTNAVKLFQQSHGLTADGICGLMTYAAMEDAQYETGEEWDGSVEEDFPAYKYKMTVQATAYSPQDPGLGKYTARGNLVGYGIVAVDPRVIPLGTRIYIPGYGIALADDTGGAIVGNKIDVAFDTHSEAASFGRQTIEIYILDD